MRPIAYFQSMKWKGSYLSDFFALIFPQLCQACGGALVSTEELICTDCLYDLPYTRFHEAADNVVARHLWGRLQLQKVFVLLYFVKGGKVQSLMHQFKYRNKPQLGIWFGQAAARQMLQTAGFTNFDIIIPVPLHPRKLKQRGYNQSERFAAGLANSLNIPLSTTNLVRVVHTQTQTRKSRFLRYENMKDVFALRDAQQLEGKHVLLVDDIVTTGSTFEACGTELLKVPGLTLSIAAIAYAE